MREFGLTDVSVSRRLKKIKAAFYGRNAAYARALASGSRDELAAALQRNVYGGDPAAAPKAAALADYVASLEAALAAIPLETFAAGQFRFPEGRTPPGV